MTGDRDGVRPTVGRKTPDQLVQDCLSATDIALLAVRVPLQHATRGVQILGLEGCTAEGLTAAADALLFEAFKRLHIDAKAPDGTPVHELHDNARDALRGMLAGLAA